MTGTHVIPAPYFFLSYARSDPLAGNPEEELDELVETFFFDLKAAVQLHASSDSVDVPGFFDREIPVGADWKQLTVRALSAAQAFVPLYSVAYLTSSWPGREVTCFRKRVMQAGRRNPVRRFVPVLWAPLAGVQDPPGLREALAPGVTDPDYADNGLFGLLKRRSYQESYRAVVNQLAVQIVELAERDPIEPVEPSKVGDIEEAPSEFPADRPLPVFSIEVAAPTAANAPESRDPRCYGESPEQWRPFPGQELALAEYARQLTERFDFDVRVDQVRQATDPGPRRPGIIVIDPAFIAYEAGRAMLKAVARTLPRWVLPLVVVAPDDEPTRKLAAGVLDILIKAKTLPTEWSGHAARDVKSLDDFVSIVPVLVAEAERQYFRYRSSHTHQSRTAGRPRLGQSEGPKGPAAESDP